MHCFTLFLLFSCTYALKTAYFGVGCFWGGEANFAKLDGVYKTRVGYAGGLKPDPTYVKIKDHTGFIGNLCNFF